MYEDRLLLGQEWWLSDRLGASSACPRQRTEKQPKKKFELVQRVKALKKLIKELNGSEG